MKHADTRPRLQAVPLNAARLAKATTTTAPSNVPPYVSDPVAWAKRHLRTKAGYTAADWREEVDSIASRAGVSIDKAEETLAASTLADFLAHKA
jgi:hypothetical protein